MFCASPAASSRSAASSAAIASFRSINWTTSASVIQIASPLISDLERSQDLLRKQFLEREPSVADALLEREVDESLERPAVLLESVRPEILPEQRLHALGVGREPGEGRVRGGDVGKPRDRAAFGFLEGFVQIHGEPRMALED